ncbi:alpha/beta fold hydrolase [Lysinibacillus sp. BF-4]|uniref:alpha/beta fold hydrolase n=1 Tax=Lysinibacillus sp. BF-4 TaxID=1473546 RepID=UPI000AF5BBEF
MTYIRMSDGHELFVRSYEPATTCRGHVHILHGMAEHSGRYDKFARFLQQQGYYVTLHDHRGHGQTAARNGKYGYFGAEAGFHRVVIDAHEVIEAVRKGKDLPQVQLIGHSMGSFIARRYVQRYQVATVILIGTGEGTLLHKAGQIVPALSAVKDEPNPLLDKLSFGSFNRTVPKPATDYDWLCANPQAVQQYIADEQCGFIATTQFYADIMEGIVLVSTPSQIAHIPKALPILMISGSEDPVGAMTKGVFAVAEQFNKAGVENVCTYIVEGKRHEILNEVNHLATYHVMLRWLQEHE